MEFIETFKRQLASTSRNVSKISLKNYLSDIRHFINWFEKVTGNNFTPEKITAEIIELYKSSQGAIISDGNIARQEKLSPSSMKRHLSSMRKFVAVMEDENLITENPFEHLSQETAERNYDYWHFETFKDYLFENSASKLTVKNYLADMRSFADWYEQAILPTLENPLTSNEGFYIISQGIVEEYKSRLVQLQSSAPRTINRKLSSLRRYLQFATAKGLISTQEIIIPSLKITGEEAQTTIVTLSDLKDAENEVKFSYSAFPPFRLFQKLLILPYLTLEELAATKIAAFMSGKKIIAGIALSQIDKARIQTQSIVRAQNRTIDSLLGVRNIKKEFYAPHTVKLSGLPLHQKIIYHAKYTRPKWYKTYHSYPFAHYVNLALLIIFAVGIGVALYQSLVGNDQRRTLAAPTAPPRILSFQGRLTDVNDNPITSATDIRFAIYNDLSASGAALLWQEVHYVVTPDQDGIFSVLLGTNDAIPSTVFSDNAGTYLGVTINSTSELTPRQRIASVAYATNSEQLQGMPPITAVGAGTSNVVLALDSSGNLTIGGSANPTFAASGGQFKLSGQPLLLTTNTGSDGNVVISPDGLGKIDIQKPVVNTTATGNIVPGGVEVNDKFGVLATESAVASFVINNDGVSDIFTASSSGTPRFTIATTGILTIPTYNTNGGIFYANGSGTLAQTSIGSAGECLQSIGGGTPTWGSCGGSGSNWRLISGALSPINDTLDLLIGSNASASAKFGFLNVASGTPTASISANSGNIATYITGDGTLATTNRQTLTIGNSSTYNTTGNVLINPNGTGNVGIGTTTVTGTGINFQVKGIGGTNVNGVRLTHGTEGSNWDLLIGGSGNSFPGGFAIADEGAAKLVVSSTGNVGIGTTSPTALLDVAGTASISGVLKLYGTPTIQSTANQTLTLGGDTTGNITLAPLNGSGTVAINGGTLNLTNGTSNLVDFGSNGVAAPSSDTTAGWKLKLYDSATANDDYGIGIASAELWNKIGSNSSANHFSWYYGTTEIARLAGTGSLQLDSGLTLSSFTSDGGVLYTNASGVLAQTGAGGATQCLLGGTTPTFGSCSTGTNTSPFQELAGAIVPNNSTLDFLLGAQATASAKFAVLNVNNGTPTASVSSGLNGNSMYMTADGTLATQKRQTLTIGNSSTYNTTGNVLINPNGTGNVGIGTTSPTQKLHLSGGVLRIAGGGASGQGEINLDSGTEFDGFQIRKSTSTRWDMKSVTAGNDIHLATDNGIDGGVTQLYLKTGGNVGIGNTAPTAKLDITGSASVSANLGFRGAATAHTLNIFDNGTLNIQRSPGGDGGLTTALFVQNNGNVGIGTTAPFNKLQAYGTLKVGGDSATQTTGVIALGDDLSANANVGIFRGTSAGASGGGNVLLLGGYDGVGITTGNAVLGSQGTPDVFVNTSGNVGIGTTTPTAKLDVNGTASVSGALKLYGTPTIQSTANQTLTLGGDTTGNIVLSPLNGSGTIQLSNFSTNGGLLYSNASGVLAQTGAGGATQCLLGGTTPTFGSCSTGTNTSPFQELSGAIVPNNSTLDFLVGGQATASAKFGVLNINSGTPTASISAGTTGGAYLSADGVIASTAKQSLTLGTTATGNINIGTDATARSVSLGNNTGASALSFTSGTGSQTFTSNVATGTTTTSGFVFDATAINSGTGMYLTTDSITTGKLLNLATTGNTLTSGTLLDLRTTATSLTGSIGNGSLLNLDWSPGSATTATGDLFALNIGTNGTTTGNLFNILDAGSSLFSVSETAVTSILPTSFNASGDVSIAYDLLFTNPTASYIKSSAPLYIQAGETFNSTDLTLSTFNKGNIIADTEAFVTNYAATISGQLVVGTSTAPANIGNFYLTNSATFGKALAILNQTESQDIFTASSSGNTRFTIANDGDITITNGDTITASSLATITSAATLGISSTALNLGAGSAATIGTVSDDNLSISPNGTGDIRLVNDADTSIIAPFFTSNGGVLYTDGSGVLAQTGAGGATQCLLGGTTPTFGSCATGTSTSPFQELAGAIVPNNSTLDLLIGGQATTSAKFAVLNIGSGTPTASISANSGNIATYITGDGTLATTNRQSLTIGNSSTYNTTGNVLINSNGQGNVGIGTTSPTQKLHLSGGVLRIAGGGANGQGEINLDSGTEFDGFQIRKGTTTRWDLKSVTAGNDIHIATDNGIDGGVTQLYLKTGGNVGIGTTGPNAKLSIKDTGAGYTNVGQLSGNSTFSGIAFGQTSALVTTSNYSLLGEGTHTYINAPSGGNIYIRNGNADRVTINSVGKISLIGSTLGQIDSTVGDFYLDNSTSNSIIFRNTSGYSERARIDSSGRLGVGTTSPISELHVTRPLSFGANGKALAIFDQIENQDILTASAGGTTKFVITNGGSLQLAGGTTIDTLTAGTLGIGTVNATTLTLGRSGQGITLPGFTSQNGVLYGTQTTGVLAQATTASTGLCLLSGASNPAWDTCPTSGGSGSNWTLDSANGVIYPINSTLDALIGGTASDSAKFAFLNISGGTPTASISANSGDNKTFLTGLGNLGTTNAQTLTLGGSTTGNVVIDSGSSAISLLDDTTISGNLSLSGTTGLTLTGAGAGITFSGSGLHEIGASSGTLRIGTHTLTGAITGGNNNIGTIGNISANSSSNTVTGFGTIGTAGTTNFNGTTLTLTGGATDITSGANEDLTITANGTGNLILTSDFNTGVKVGTSANIIAPLSVSGGIGSNAGFILDQLNEGDLFTASAAGVTKFVLTNGGSLQMTGGQTIDTLAAGTLGIGTTTATTLTLGRSGQGITLPGFTSQNGVLYGTQTTGVLAQATTASTGLCLLSGASNPAWDTCPGAGSSGSNWTLDSANGVIYPNNNTVDFLLGGSATTSAKFAVIGVDGTTVPTASVSAQNVAGQALSLKGDGTIQSARNNTLTLGGDSTGNIVISPNNGSTGSLLTINSINQAWTGTTTLTASSLATITSAATLGISSTTLNLGAGSAATIGTLSDDNLTLTPNGTGDLILTGDFDTQVLIGATGATTKFPLLVRNGIGSNAALAIDNLNSGDLFTASASGITKFVISNDGRVGINTAASPTGVAPLAMFQIFSSLGTAPAASIAANTSWAALQINQEGVGDIFAASKSGGFQAFRIKNNGDVVVGDGGVGTKITVETQDPLYNIDGKKYSTFTPSMLGFKEEITGRQVLAYDNSAGAYSYKFDFNNAVRESDFWVFSRVIKPDIKDVSILMTPNSPARTWYKKDGTSRTITMYSDRPVEISYRMTAPQINSDKWPTIALPKDYDIHGVDTPPPPNPVGNSEGDNNIAIDPYFDTLTVNEQNGQWILKDSYNNKVNHIDAFSKAIIARVESGWINAKKITTDTISTGNANIGNLAASTLSLTSDSITIGGQNIRDFIIATVQNAGLAQSGQQIISPLASIDQIRTNIISPLAEEGSVALHVNPNDFEIKNTQTGETVAKIDNQGNVYAEGNLSARNVYTEGNLSARSATFSGTLNSEVALFDDASVSGTLAANSLETNNASVAGTLRADKIIANDIDLSDEALAKLGNNINSNTQSQASGSGSFVDGGNLAVGSLNAQFGLFEQGIVALGPATFGQITAIDSISIGQGFILGNNSINTLGADLEIQPLRQGNISFMAGRVKIDTDGNMAVDGNIQITGNIAAARGIFSDTIESKALVTNMISPLPDSDLIFKLGSDNFASNSGKLQIQDIQGKQVLAINNKGDIVSSGSAKFAKLNLNLVGKAEALNENESVATGSAGFATLKRGRPEITIINPNVTSESLIYITPFGDTSNKVLYLLRQTPHDPEEEIQGSFTVGVSGTPTTRDMQFNWLVVN